MKMLLEKSFYAITFYFSVLYISIFLPYLDILTFWKVYFLQIPRHACYDHRHDNLENVYDNHDIHLEKLLYN